jgi:hypothetical protein
MRSALRRTLCLILALTFGATSFAPGLFHGCEAGRAMASVVLRQGTADPPAADCEHHAGAPHRHSSSGDCNCLGHACCSVAVAVASNHVGFAIGSSQAVAAAPVAVLDGPTLGLRHRQPPALAPPSFIA